MDVVQGGSAADNVMCSSTLFWSAVSASSLEESSWAQMLKIQAYKLEELREATGDFSSLLGEGSNGQVFAGILDRRPVAVKRLRRGAWNVPAEREVLEHEIKSIAAVNHANIVPLLGFCLEGETPLLVCPQLRSLQQDLPFLNWEARYRIAIGVARALAYLHLGARKPMIHCDVKPGNVLYQEGSHDAYLADFGLVYFVRSHEELLPDQMINQGNRPAAQDAFVRGTRGYMAPEVRRSGELSTKADVYSYGKLLYALVSGRQEVHSVSCLPPSLVITRRAAAFLGLRSRITAVFSSLFQHRTNLRSMVDPIVRPNVLGSSRLFLQASKALDLVALCIAEAPSRRPNMEEVVAALEKAERCSIPCIVKATVLLGPTIPKILTFFLLLSFYSYAALVILITIFYTFFFNYEAKELSYMFTVVLPQEFAHAPSPSPGVSSKVLQSMYLIVLMIFLCPYAFVVLYTTTLWLVIFIKLLYKPPKRVHTIR